MFANPFNKVRKAEILVIKLFGCIVIYFSPITYIIPTAEWNTKKTVV